MPAMLTRFHQIGSNRGYVERHGYEQSRDVCGGQNGYLFQNSHQ